ncbi:MAG: Na+/H+ antiporter subunit E [Actinomycetota bacterium]|nr:Na+/H+ antiporter subunit E [Actinomycetota bacterium]
MKTVRRAALLMGFWLLAWGEVSTANVVSGVVLIAVLFAAFPPRRHTTGNPRVSVVGAARLVVYVLVELVPSNVLVAREVVSRGSRIRAGVLAHHLEHPSEEVLSLMAHVIALTPGTMAVEATPEPSVLYVHFLLLEDLDEARRRVARLERLVVTALGGPDAVRGVVTAPPGARP